MMKKGGTCPLCNAPLLSTKLDVNFQHQVNSLPVFCSKRNKGCNWKGKLEELDLHALLCSKVRILQKLEMMFYYPVLTICQCCICLLQWVPVNIIPAVHPKMKSTEVQTLGAL